jgi:hypothetical protein
LALGELDQGFVWLERAYKDQDFFVRWINVHPLFQEFRSDKRFEKIVRKMGLDQ